MVRKLGYSKGNREASPEATLVGIALISIMYIGSYLRPLINSEENQ